MGVRVESLKKEALRQYKIAIYGIPSVIVGLAMYKLYLFNTWGNTVSMIAGLYCSYVMGLLVYMLAWSGDNNG